MKKIFGMIIMILPVFAVAQQIDISEGIALYEKGDYQHSKTYFAEKAEEHKNADEVFYYLALSEHRLLNLDEAENNLRKAIKINDSVSDYYMWLGTIYREKLQQVSFFEKGILSGKALDNYKKAVKCDPDNITARIHLASYYIHAPSIGGGSISKAKEQITEIRKQSPEEATRLMALIYMQSEEYDKAIEEFMSLLKSDPENTDIYYQIGMIYQGMNRFDEATAMFTKAVEINPEAYASLYQIGRTAIFSESNLDRGIESMTLYVNGEPGASSPAKDAAYWRLGMLYELNGDASAAREAYTKAASMNPDEEKYQDALDALKE